MFHKVLGIFGMVGGLTYQWSDDVGQLLCHLICDGTSAGNNSLRGCHIHGFLNRLQTRINHMQSTIQAHNWSNRHWNKNTNNTNTHNIYIVLPYTKGLSEGFMNVCDNIGIQDHFKGGNVIRNHVVANKDKDTIAKKSGAIYSLSVPRKVVKRNTLGSLEGP